MYLSNKICELAYSHLGGVDPAGSGKTAVERVSGLRYLLAAARIIKAHGSTSIDLSPPQSDNRIEFSDYVGDVVRINSNYYSKNFRDHFGENGRNYDVSSNFLTVGALRNNGSYPGRPAPLLDKNQENLSLNPNWKSNIQSFGEWESYRTYLAIWLCRFADFPGISLVSEVKDFLRDTYGHEIEEELINDDLLESILSMDELSKKVADLSGLIVLREDKGDYLFSEQDPTLIGYNKIFYGAPGTGKSYRIHKEECRGFEPFVTVFHSDTQYSDFVGSLKPSIEKNAQGEKSVTYKFRPGPFTSALIYALANSTEPVFLVIEEINRASAAAVFGELFQLLDRDANGASEYQINIADPDMLDYINEQLERSKVPEINKVYIPSNMSILATMNSSDQAVMPLDTAFKRRWLFEYLPIDFSRSEVPNADLKINLGESECSIPWKEFAQIINQQLAFLRVHEDRHIGPFFLSGKELDSEDSIHRSLNGKLFVYLWDDVLRHIGYDKIFAPNLSTFGQLSEAFRRGDCVFNNKICDQIKEKADSE